MERKESGNVVEMQYTTEEFLLKMWLIILTTLQSNISWNKLKSFKPSVQCEILQVWESGLLGRRITARGKQTAEITLPRLLLG